MKFSHSLELLIKTRKIFGLILNIREQLHISFVVHLFFIPSDTSTIKVWIKFFLKKTEIQVWFTKNFFLDYGYARGI